MASSASSADQPDLPVFLEGPPKLSDLRDILIRLEETIIFALIERAQFKRNTRIYLSGDAGVFAKVGSKSDLATYGGSYLEFILERTEQVHSLVNRYTSPDEEAFFPDRISNAALLPAQNYPPVLHPNTININKKLLSIYSSHIIPGLCDDGDDRQYGSAAVCDTVVLQALSRRIHYGKFVAEAKFAADKEAYSERIRNGDATWLMEALTVKAIEEKVLSRVELKASTYGRDPRESGSTSPPPSKRSKRKRYKVDPSRIRALYADWVMPLTKEVELEYLLQRLSGPTVSFCGLRSLTHEVALRIASSDDSCVSCATDKEVVQSVMSNRTAFGVLPLADASGIVRRTKSLLCSTDQIVVCGVRRTRHRFRLVGIVAKGKKEGAVHDSSSTLSSNKDSVRWTSVHTIFTDMQASACCAGWLEVHTPQANIVRVQDSRVALRRVRDANTRANSCSLNAALILDLDADSSTRSDTRTESGAELEALLEKTETIALISGPSTVVRHAVISKNLRMPSGNDRTLLQFEVQDAPGALNSVLTIFQLHHINLTMLESHPVAIDGSDGLSQVEKRCAFFVECEGHARDAALIGAFGELQKGTRSFRVIGSYQHEP